MIRCIELERHLLEDRPLGPEGLAACGALWQPIGCPIDKSLQPGGLENRSWMPWDQKVCRPVAHCGALWRLVSADGGGLDAL